MLNSNEDLIHIVKQNALKGAYPENRECLTPQSLTFMESGSKKLIGVIPIDSDQQRLSPRIVKSTPPPISQH